MTFGDTTDELEGAIAVKAQTAVFTDDVGLMLLHALCNGVGRPLRQVLFHKMTPGIQDRPPGSHSQKKASPCLMRLSCWHYLSSRAVARQVLSARVSLTSVFGMGTGGPSQQSIPTRLDGLFPIFYGQKPFGF